MPAVDVKATGDARAHYVPRLSACWGAAVSASSCRRRARMSLTMTIFNYGRFQFIVSREDWLLSPSAAISTSVRIDDAILAVMSEVTEKRFLVIVPDEPTVSLSELAEGNQFVVRVNGRDYETTLSGSRRAVQFLISCIKKHGPPELVARFDKDMRVRLLSAHGIAQLCAAHRQSSGDGPLLVLLDDARHTRFRPNLSPSRRSSYSVPRSAAAAGRAVAPSAGRVNAALLLPTHGSACGPPAALQPPHE